MRRLLLLTVCLTPTWPSSALADEPSGDAAVPSDVARALIGEGLANPRGYGALTHLADDIGSRLAGSPAMAKAVTWAVAEFKRRGLAQVTTEEFTMETWRRGPLLLEITAPVRRRIEAVAMGFSPPTAGAKEGPLVDAHDGSPAVIASLGERLRGAIVLIGPADDGSSPAPKTAGAAFAACKKAGAAAVLLQWGRSDVKASHRRTFRELPTAVISREDGEFLRRMGRAAGGARMRLQMAARITPHVKQQNVLAEIAGRENPDEVVVLGAHLDSWDLGPGATDNAHGVAAVLEAARLLATVRPPRRTIRFALFAAEEPGLLGSQAYVTRHAAELPKHVLMINEDTGPGHVAGVHLLKRPDGRAALERIVHAAAGLGVERVLDTNDVGSDSYGFLAAGVPAIELERTGYDYFRSHHTALDTADKVAPSQLARLATALAVIAWGVADAPERIAPHLSGEALSKAMAEP